MIHIHQKCMFAVRMRTIVFYLCSTKPVIFPLSSGPLTQLNLINYGVANINFSFPPRCSEKHHVSFLFFQRNRAHTFLASS
jgi:hypothetical protein